MTPDPSTPSPAPVPAADTHSSHSLRLTLSPSPLALCLPQSRPVSVYLYLYRYQINMSCWRFPRGLTGGSRFQLCYLSLFHLSVSFCDAHILRLFSSWILKSLMEAHNRNLWGTSFPSHSFVYFLICGLIYIYWNVLISLIKFIQIH